MQQRSALHPIIIAGIDGVGCVALHNPERVVKRCMHVADLGVSRIWTGDCLVWLVGLLELHEPIQSNLTLLSPMHHLALHVKATRVTYNLR